MPPIYYDVQIQGIELHPILEHIVTKWWHIGGVKCRIDGHEELDLLYHLTSPKSSFHKLMMKQKDGKYRMNVWKESMTSFYRRTHGKKYGVSQTPTFKWHGWMIFTKRKDDIAVDNRWFQVGNMNKLNLDVEPRDVQREVKNTNWNKIPGGGLPRPFSFDEAREDSFSENTKSRVTNVH